MQQQLLIGLAAGAAAALLYGSFTAGTPIAVLLFYIATLPLFIAGLGWGWATAGLAALAGAVGLAVTVGLLAGALFLLAVGGPATWLSYLAGLSRAVANGAGNRIEWYPVGRLVIWAAGLAGALIVVGLASFGFSYEAYEQSIRQMFSAMMEQGGETPELPEGVSVNDLVTFFVIYLPPVSAVAYMATTLASLYIAARVVQVSGRLKRPWPDLAAFDLPRLFAAALAVGIVLSFLPGVFGLIAGAATAGIVFAYTLLGLAVMHTVTRPSPLRPLILGAVYFTVIFLGWAGGVVNWPALLLAFLGLLEGPLNVRARVPRGRGGPPAPRNGGGNS